MRLTRSQLRIALVAAAMAALFGIAVALNMRYATTHLQANGHNFTLQIADNESTREKGLGGRSSLAPNAGMLFVFPHAAVQCFWMKDMRFSLDMIWLNSSKQVMHIERNVAPQTYPHTYCPTPLAQYVIELNANAAQHAGIRVGQTLRF